jgi:signal transduction histidine kinase
MLLAPLAFMLMVAGVHDFTLIQNHAAFLRVPLLPYATGAMLLVLGGMIGHRLSRALQTKANLNRLLAERVQLHEADLARKHQTIVRLERERARSQEREQLLRDLHDGLGSSLASARMQVEEGSLDTRQLHQVLDDCIADMRLLLDTSAPDSGLASAVGNLRYRLDQRLAGSGITLVWRLGLEEEPPLGARSRLDLMRLLQEALTNALRHAHASRIVTTVRYDTQGRQLHVSVQDDGRGFKPVPAGTPGASRGLANMRHRARQLGGELVIEGGEGTRVELTLRFTPAHDAVEAA